MKLRNKKTGEIIRLIDHTFDNYNSLAELEREWEDYEAPKEYYYIADFGAIREGDVGKFVEDEESRKEIDNYFETREEAEKAVEKLKAWKRLKDKGFKFKNSSLDICCHTINFKVDNQYDMTDETSKDLFLLFGGEE